MPRKRERWLTARAAAEAGVEPATFRHYTRRVRGAPQPIPDEFGPRGERVFFADEVRAWIKSRPGRGWHGPRTSR